MQVLPCLLCLLLAVVAEPTAGAPSGGPPTAAEIRQAADDQNAYQQTLIRWLDAYPASAQNWPTRDLALAIASLVSADLAHHPNADGAAERLAELSLIETPRHLESVAESLRLAAFVQLRQGHNDKAATLLDQGEQLCATGITSDAEARFCSMILRDRSILEMRRGQYAKASLAIDRALRWLAPFPQLDSRVALLYSAADLACWRGEVESCLQHYQQATDLSRAIHGENDETTAYGYLGIGWAAALAGDWGLARAHYEQAERVWTEQLGAAHPRLADALIYYGELLHDSGDSESAVEILRRAVALRESRLGPEAFDLPRALDALGQALIDLGELAPAQTTLERSTAIRRLHLDSEHIDHAKSLRALAALARAQGEDDRARRLLRQALSDSRRIHGDEHPAVAEIAAELAELYIELQPQLAIDLAARSRAGLARAYGAEHPAVAHAWELDAHARLSVGLDAVGSALQAEEISRHHLRRIAQGHSENDLLRYARVRPAGTDLALEALLASATRPPSRVAAVWQTVVRSRGLVFDTLVELRQPELGSPAANELQIARQALAHLLVSASGPDSELYSRRLTAARERVEQAERSLSLGVATTPHAATELATLLDRLPPRGALVAYRIFSSGGDTRLAAFVGGKGAVAVVDLGAWAPIEASLGKWRQAFLASDEDAYLSPATELRRKIWDPLQPHLSDARRVFLVPDGAMFLLPFASLPGDHGYLIENGLTLHTLGAERDLLETGPEAFSSGRILVVGDPRFDRPAEIGSLDRAPFLTPLATLPGARAEARAVAAAWRRWAPETEVEQVEGSQATEALWQSRASGTTALHLATHGFFVDSSAGQSRPIGSTGQRAVGGLVAQANLGERGSLSGFMLARNDRSESRSGFRDGADDGIVTLEEIRQLHLQSTRLVVLSFCDSGLGDTHTGEGIFGFTRAFRSAGAGSLVLALAPVADDSSKRFMEHFYAAVLGEELQIDQAVRKASLALLAERRSAGSSTHPRHWAGWVSVGPVLPTRPFKRSTE